MTITALPPAPSTSDPTTFAAKADALLAALATFISEANAVAVAMNLNSTTDTSASSVAIGTGAKTFTVTAGKSFQPGMFLVIADTAAPSTNSMYGQITSYSTNQLVMNILAISGSGTKTAWTITQSAGGGAYAATADTLNSGEVTVTAHATTGDIFAAAANSILWDDAGGAITTTIFPNASKAGMVRELRCNGASKFTAGANLLIEGIPSGTTITLANGALVKVRAITTTQFKLTTSTLSGSFIPTGVMSTSGTVTLTGSKIIWEKTGNRVFYNGIIIFPSVSSPLGTLSIGTFPYTSSGTTHAAVAITGNGLGSGVAHLAADMQETVTSISVWKFASGALVNFAAGDIVNNAQMYISGSYTVN